MNFEDGRQNCIFKPTFPRANSLRRAFSLVQLFHPNLDFDAWVAYTRFFTRMSRQRGGLVIFEDSRGYVHALFAYRLTYHLRHRQVLHVSDILMGHLPGQTLARALIAEATKIGKDRGCTSILLEFAEEGAAPLRDVLADMGFRPVAAHLHVGPWLAS